MSGVLGPDGRLATPDGDTYKFQRGDLPLLTIVWRGSHVMILTDRPVISRLSFDDKRRVSDSLRKIFEQDFGVLL